MRPWTSRREREEENEEEDTAAVIPYVAVEVDDAHDVVSAVKVVIEATLTWGGSILSVTHTTPTSRLVRVRDLGLPASSEIDDLVIAKAHAHARETALVLPNGEIVPRGCRLSLRLPSSGERAALLRLALVPADVDAIPRSKNDGRVAKGVLLGALIHGAILACAIFGRASIGEQEEMSRLQMTGYLASIDARSEREIAAAEESAASGGSIDTGKNKKDQDPASEAKKREAGLAGNPTRVNEGGMAMKANGAERRGQSEAARVETFGMIALLNGESAKHADAGRSAFADFEGPAAMGSIFGTRAEDAAGNGGLGLSGIGEGGGGKGAGVPAAGLGTSAFGAGGSCDDACASRLGFGKGKLGNGMGFGVSHGRTPHEAHAPTLRYWVSDGYGMVNGRLPPEAVQRIVRQNFGRLRACYESGLLRNPSLEGRVAVKFVIDRSGAVSFVSVAESSLPDATVNACVARTYQTMSFPKPEGGIVTVVYPVVFNAT